MNKLLLKILLPILMKLIPRISDELKGVLVDSIMALYVRAKATDNPYDDLAIELLAGILDIELPD